ncbi:MAG: thiamine-phosphate kinase [Caulobacteraceae bacterium]|nr:thiamine-phosphate kinase [Caulobacteraceae bacterium]
MPAPPDEFAWIELIRPLTRGDPRALDLLDDAAILPGRNGFELVVSADAMVEGVHFLADERPAVIARRLLRTSLSDLAAKAARPFGYFLTTAWPQGRPMGWKAAFAEGLREDGDEFGVALLGGDTVSTDGPLVLSATVLGWARAGTAVLRSGARVGDRLMVCGVIGDGLLGLRAARGEIADPGGRLAAHYRTPKPWLALREPLGRYARAAADVSDGLLADAGHLARASGVKASIRLEALPLSIGAAAWLAEQDDEGVTRRTLAAGGDDYAIVCAVAPEDEDNFRAAVVAEGAPVATVGALTEGEGVQATFHGLPVNDGPLGFVH